MLKKTEKSGELCQKNSSPKLKLMGENELLAKFCKIESRSKQNRSWSVQNADCRPDTKCRLHADTKWKKWCKM